MHSPPEPHCSIGRCSRARLLRDTGNHLACNSTVVSGPSTRMAPYCAPTRTSLRCLVIAVDRERERYYSGHHYFIQSIHKESLNEVTCKESQYLSKISGLDLRSKLKAMSFWPMSIVYKAFENTSGAGRVLLTSGSSLPVTYATIYHHFMHFMFLRLDKKSMFPKLYTNVFFKGEIH